MAKKKVKKQNRRTLVQQNYAQLLELSGFTKKKKSRRTSRSIPTKFITVETNKKSLGTFTARQRRWSNKKFGQINLKNYENFKAWCIGKLERYFSRHAPAGALITAGIHYRMVMVYRDKITGKRVKIELEINSYASRVKNYPRERQAIYDDLFQDRLEKYLNRSDVDFIFFDELVAETIIPPKKRKKNERKKVSRRRRH